MISAETCYKTHDAELLTIVEVFKTWKHYLEECKHEVLVLIDHNNLQRFLDTRNPSLRQVYCAQELSRYYFRIDYYPSRANRAANTLSQYFLRSAEGKNIFRAKKTKILHQLQYLPARVSGLRVVRSKMSLHLHQVSICEVVVLLQLYPV